MKPCLFALAALASLPCTVSAAEYYGTLTPFASKAVYFLMTDRFVNGDPGNDHRQQGGVNRSFDRPVPGAPAGESDNIGYLGGDFKGIANNAPYIKRMGFGAIWLTPIVDNPDEAFTGGDAVQWHGQFQDQGKTGYHGYWGDNFYQLDEHLPSPGLDFSGLTRSLHQAGLQTVLDIVCNHGSPAFGMPVAQAKFGQIFDKDWHLIADHQNLPAAQLDPEHKPLHRFYNTKTEMVQLSDLNENNPEVMDYLVGAYLQWIGQGAAAFRIDTIKHMPVRFWKTFSDRIRAKHPNFFMFAEAYDFNPDLIAPYTWPKNGGISVLDFPLKKQLAQVFEHPNSDYATLAPALYLKDSPYQNAYELMTFYDNHDMPRLNADDNGFIDAHNWLFTARGIPVIYYGSEIGFMRGTAEHQGNRNYLGQARIDAAPSSPIYQHLQRIAQLRAHNVALQKGLQVNLHLQGNQAMFLRVFEHQDQHQILLVMLNKGAQPAVFQADTYLQAGTWQALISQSHKTLHGRAPVLRHTVPAHGVEVWRLNATVSNPTLKQLLKPLMQAQTRHTSAE